MSNPENAPSIPKRSIQIPAGLYSIEGVPVFLPTITAEVHTPNAADLQRLIAKCQVHGIKTSEQATAERATEDDFRAKTEGGFARVSQHLEAQNLSLGNIGATLERLNARLDALERPTAADGEPKPDAPKKGDKPKKD